MSMEKRVIPFLLAGGVLLGAACGSNSENTSRYKNSQRPTPMVTRSPGEVLMRTEQRQEYNKHLFEIMNFITTYLTPQAYSEMKRVILELSVASDKKLLDNFLFTEHAETDKNGNKTGRIVKKYKLRGITDTVDIHDASFLSAVELTIPVMNGKTEPAYIDVSVGRDKKILEKPRKNYNLGITNRTPQTQLSDLANSIFDSQYLGLREAPWNISPATGPWRSYFSPSRQSFTQYEFFDFPVLRFTVPPPTTCPGDRFVAKSC